MAIIAIQGVSYKALAPLAPQDYALFPFDLNGNIFGLVTINVDTTGGKVKIALPQISTLKDNYNCKIVIVRTAGTNAVTVSTSGTDIIGTASAVQLNFNNQSIEVTPVEAINWYGVITP
jgi:hypothetical protein